MKKFITQMFSTLDAYGGRSRRPVQNKIIKYSIASGEAALCQAANGKAAPGSE
jgi:hypothetical protein